MVGNENRRKNQAENGFLSLNLENGETLAEKKVKGEGEIVVEGIFIIEQDSLLLTDTTEDLGLLNSDDAGSLVLTLLTLLTGSLGLLVETDALEAVARLVGRQSLGVIVDQTETSGLTSSISNLEAIDHDELLISDFVHLGHLGGQFSLGDGGTAGMDDIDDELLAGQQLVVDELASADRAGLIVRHLYSNKNKTC